MAASVIILLFFLFCFLYSFPHFIASVESCGRNQCSKDEHVISYPFRIKSRQGERCGYPGFDLTCDDMNYRTVLELPSSGRFFLQDISYGRTYNEIRLRDPDDCLPRRVLNQLNLSGTPFFGRYYQNYSFYSCQLNTSSYDSSWIDIDCLSNSTHKVFAATSLSSHKLWDNTNCTLIGTVPVPVDYISKEIDSYPRFPFKTVLNLKWKLKCKGNCKKRWNNTSFGGHEVPNGSSTSLIVVSILIPTGIAISLCYLILRSKGYFSGGSTTELTSSSEIVTITTGLDGSTLKSIPTTVLGESGRLPDPDHKNTCSICLSEYLPKEALKTIPACKHCFHADCIDVWLRLNSTCPVYRMSPVASSNC